MEALWLFEKSNHCALALKVIKASKATKIILLLFICLLSCWFLTREPRKTPLLELVSYYANYIIRNDIITPAATAEPITPETLGAIACMSRWFDGSYF